ncbi:MAG: hypothetical protein IPI45_06735 [Saprospiraceae bacterium]|nr:hypothetical protein [Saprospiraceae bacterium]MBK7737455.1 hypothetical protein [Saprospiraceae bacterium]MBK7913965.1 hypothetical protein [Saprospiraceae bacterium]
MSIAPVFLYVFFGILVICSLVALWIVASKFRLEARDAIRDKNELRLIYDQLRKEKFDLDEKILQTLEQERTYKVAYEDWKSKYVILEEKYLEVKRKLEDPSLITDFEQSNQALKQSQNLNQELELKVFELEQQLLRLKTNQKLSESESGDSKIVADLKSILDQHLMIISNIIGDEKMEQYTQKAQPSDPLHLIKGIDEDVESRLISKGIRSFDQIKNTSKKDLRKWMVEFDEIDDKLIESWPYQAEAILNVTNEQAVRKL